MDDPREPMTVEEVEELLGATLHGPLPQTTVWRMMATLAEWRQLPAQLEAARKQIADQNGDVRRMTFIRGILERADRADMNEQTTDRFVVREIQRICKADEREGDGDG